jgi:hypothetical protein
MEAGATWDWFAPQLLQQLLRKERTMNKLLVSVFAIATMFGSATYAAEQCTNATVHGTYGFHGLAFIVPASGGAATPRAIIGVFTLDGKGNWTTSLTLDDNGVITHPPAAGSAGTYKINPDCTGTFYIGSGGVVAVVVVDHGNEFYQMRTDPASVVLYGTTKRIFPGKGED